MDQNGRGFRRKMDQNGWISEGNGPEWTGFGAKSAEMERFWRKMGQNGRVLKVNGPKWSEFQGKWSKRDEKKTKTDGF